MQITYFNTVYFAFNPGIFHKPHSVNEMLINKYYSLKFRNISNDV